MTENVTETVQQAERQFTILNCVHPVFFPESHYSCLLAPCQAFSVICLKNTTVPKLSQKPYRVNSKNATDAEKQHSIRKPIDKTPKLCQTLRDNPQSYHRKCMMSTENAQKQQHLTNHRECARNKHKTNRGLTENVQYVKRKCMCIVLATSLDKPLILCQTHRALTENYHKPQRMSTENAQIQHIANIIENVLDK